ncbi:hypothetical protein GGX14DRAFT_401453 [Mycena pura]|uniref:Uncharacterized protein n=1 Tax=Mycena pura TaxID=153505 RepID=A0AAD6V3Z5_9AGAR|nr:hypothetical protein GGX14DRAFT_401453 [Mycena pura]
MRSSESHHTVVHASAQKTPKCARACPPGFFCLSGSSSPSSSASEGTENAEARVECESESGMRSGGNSTRVSRDVGSASAHGLVDGARSLNYEEHDGLSHKLASGAALALRGCAVNPPSGSPVVGAEPPDLTDCGGLFLVHCPVGACAELSTSFADEITASDVVESSADDTRRYRGLEPLWTDARAPLARGAQRMSRRRGDGTGDGHRHHLPKTFIPWFRNLDGG